MRECRNFIDYDLIPLIRDIINKKKIECDVYDTLLLDALIQAAGDKLIKNKIQIDNQCLSAYEKACVYLEKKGKLQKVNERIYSYQEG